MVPSGLLTVLIVPIRPDPSLGVCPAETVSGGHAWVHDPVHLICPFVSVANRYRVWPFGPVRTVPTDVAVPELTTSDPPLVVVVPEAAGVVVEEEVDESGRTRCRSGAASRGRHRDGGEKRRRAPTLLRADPGIDLIVERCIFVSDLG